MNQTASAPGASLLPDTTDIFTAGHLALVAVLAVLVIAGLIWGVRLARGRKTAEREIRAHNAELGRETTAQPERRSGEDRRRPVPAADDEVAEPVLSPEEANAPTELLFDKIPDAGERFTSPQATAPDAPAAEASATDANPAAAGPVTQLKGLGPRLAGVLAGHGITTVGQIAALTDDEAAALDARLGPFTGRMARDRWQEQARFLATGDQAGFEAVFGRL